MVLNDAAESSDLADPLVGHSSFSFNFSSLIRPLSNPNLGSLVSHIKTMALKNPDSLVNLGRTVTNGSMDLLESDKATATASEEKSEAVNATKHQEKRPARERKRAKFSAKPIPSQSDASLEPSLDVNKLQNPDEFFETFEKMENAKKELQRQKGQPLVEIDNNRISLSPRRRRPSIFEKSATYKHRSYSLSGVPNNDEAVLSSQEAYDHRMPSPTPEDAIPETVALTFSPQTRVSDTKPTMSTKVSELDELLSCDFEGLDENGVQNILQDKLNIKLVNIGRPSLPDMPDVRRREYASSIGVLPDMKDSIFHLNDSSKAASSKPLNFSYRLRKGSNNQVSPTLCKSPLASISLLNKHISRLTPSNDPFSPLDIDSSPEMISYPGAQNGKQPEQVGQRIDSHEFSRSPMNEEETSEAVTSPPASAVDSRSPNIEPEEQLGGVSHSDKLVTIKDSHKVERSQNDITVSDEKLPSEVAEDMPPSENPETWMDGIRHTAQAGTMGNLFEIRSPTDGEDNMAVSGEPSLACAAKDMDVNNGPTEEDQIAGGPESVGKKAFNEGSAMGNASGNGGNGEMDAPLNTQGTLIEKPKKKTAGISKSRRKETEQSSTSAQGHIYEETVTEGRKKKAKSNAPVVKEPKNKKRKLEGPPPESSAVKSQLRRHSLYAAGTKWETGLRRSTRIKMRPLEFWRGERLLYGRVHNSVVSVIGVKYASPKKGEEGPGVKVKSFVSDEYKDLLDLASSH